MNARQAVQENEVIINHSIARAKRVMKVKKITLLEAAEYGKKCEMGDAVTDSQKVAIDIRYDEVIKRIELENEALIKKYAATNYDSRAHKITGQHLSQYFDGELSNVLDLEIYHIEVRFSGHGHYTIIAEFIVNDEKLKIKTTTNNMPLIDAWKSLMSDNYEEGEDGYDNEDEIIESMLSAINPEDRINNLAKEQVWNKEEE